MKNTTKMKAWALKDKVTNKLLIKSSFDLFPSREDARMTKWEDETVVKLEIEIKEVA